MLFLTCHADTCRAVLQTEATEAKSWAVKTVNNDLDHDSCRSILTLVPCYLRKPPAAIPNQLSS